MKKSVLKVYESKETIMKLGNHAVDVKPRALPVTIIADKDLEAVTFEANRVFYYHEHPVCVVNDNAKTFRLSHAGIYAKVKKTGEVKEGEWPKTCTQTLLMYRDLLCGDGYTEIEPIEGRPARDWRKHMEEYEKQKAMRKAGIIPPRKSRAKKAKINEAMLELLEKEFGLSREQVLAKMAEKTEPAAPATPNLPMCLPVYTCTADMIHDWFSRKPIPANHCCFAFEIKGEYYLEHEHADADWWESELAKSDKKEVSEPKGVIIDAEYINNLVKKDGELKKETVKKAVKKSLGAKVEKNAKKATAKKTTDKKTTAKKTTAKKTTKKATKKEAVA